MAAKARSSSGGRTSRASTRSNRTMSFFGVQEIIENCNYLNALNEENAVSTEVLKTLLSYEDNKVRMTEERLRAQGYLTFSVIFHEPAGAYLFERFLADQYPEDLNKALFMHDVHSYAQMRFEPARFKVAKLICDRYLGELPPPRSAQEKKRDDGDDERDTDPSALRRPSVFEAIKLRNMEKRKDTPTFSRENTARADSFKGAVDESKARADGDAKTQDKRKPPVHRRNESSGSAAGAEPYHLEVGDPNALRMRGDAVKRVADYLYHGQAPKDLFGELQQEVKALLVRDVFPEFVQSEFFKQYLQIKQMEEVALRGSDFTTMRLLGRGGFGTVFACKKIDSGRLYAMKAINKKLIKWKKAVAMTMLERHTLALVDSRFVCNLCFAFQDKTHLYLVMPLMAGGDLKFHLMKQRHAGTGSLGFSRGRARFHAAEILLGLEAMHQKNIIFRDLKLENVLLDEDGHCRISDLGLVALYGKKKVSHYAGTPGYIAPEVAQKKPYGPAVDLFSLGVTLYRMMCGKKPFKGHSRKDFDRAVVHDEPQFDPSIFDERAVSLLRGLMEKDPKKRLGCGPRGIQDIKDHPFFASIDWGLLEVGYLDPPFVPSKHDVNANSLEDIGFQDGDAKQYEKVELDERFHRQVQGFEYVNSTTVQDELVGALQKSHEEEKARARRRRKKKGKNGKKGKKGKKSKKKKGENTGCCVVM